MFHFHLDTTDLFVSVCIAVTSHSVTNYDNMTVIHQLIRVNKKIVSFPKWPVMRDGFTWYNGIFGCLVYTTFHCFTFLQISTLTSQWPRWRLKSPASRLFTQLFIQLCSSKKTSKLRVTGLCVGTSPGQVNSPHKGPVTRKMFPFDDVIMWYLLGQFWHTDSPYALKIKPG